MLRRLTELPAEIVGVEAVGTVTRDDYTVVLEPLLEDARREGRRIRFLYRLGHEFKGFTPGAAWEDARVGARFMRLFDACAVVTDADWVRHAVSFFGAFLPCPVRVFRTSRMQQAVKWLRTFPARGPMTHRLLPELGVVVVEFTAPLRAQEFDQLAATVDAWIESHGELRGIVVHARRFRGWKDLDGLLRHLRFVRNHHRKIRRVAVASDSKATRVVPRIVTHFVKAEVRSFAYDALDEAVVWAGGRDRA